MKGLKLYTTWVFPSAVVTTEYILSRIIGVRGNTAIAQFHNSKLIQTTSLFGVFGISFLVAWFASLLSWVTQKGMKTTRLWLGLSIYGIIMIAVILFGFVSNNSTPDIEETVKIAAIVGETDIHQVFMDFEEEIIALSKNHVQEIPADVFSDSSDLELLIERTEVALSIGAEIVVWNEISLLVIPSQVDSIVKRVKDLCVKYHAFVQLAVLEKHDGDLPKPFYNNRGNILVQSNSFLSDTKITYAQLPLIEARTFYSLIERASVSHETMDKNPAFGQNQEY